MKAPLRPWYASPKSPEYAPRKNASIWTPDDDDEGMVKSFFMFVNRSNLSPALPRRKASWPTVRGVGDPVAPADYSPKPIGESDLQGASTPGTPPDADIHISGMVLDGNMQNNSYFWAGGGTALAMLAPDVEVGFPDPAFLSFFALHGLVVASAAVLVFGFGCRPRPGAPRRAFLLTNAYAAVVAP